MAEQEAQFRIRFVVDDRAAETAKNVANNVQEIEKPTQAAAGWMVKMTDSVSFLAAGPWGAVVAGAKTIADGFQVAASMAAQLGHAAMEAAAEEEAQLRSLSGSLMMLTGGKRAFHEIREYAEDIHSEFEGTGRAIGVSSEAIEDAYRGMAERGLGSERSKQLALEMANVGKIVRGGIEGISQGFAMMELGMVRAKNPLVQLIAMTGTLHGNAKAVAQQLQKMPLEKQLKLAEEAIQKQSGMMEKGGVFAVPTLGQLRESFSGFREMFLETMGGPMLDKLVPKLDMLKNWLVEHTGAIEDYARQLGEQFGQFIDFGSDAIYGVFMTVKENWPAIKQIGKDLGAPFMEAWKYAVEHKTEIIGALSSAADSFVHATKSMIDAGKTVGNDIESTLRKLGAAGSMVFGGPVGSIMHSMMLSHDQEGARQALHAAAVNPMVAPTQFGNLDLAFRKAATEAGASLEEINRTTAEMTRLRDSTASSVKYLASAAQQEDVERIAQAYNLAHDQNNKGMQQYVASLVAGSEGLAIALMSSNVELKGGFDDFADMVAEKSEKIGKVLKAYAGERLKDIAGKGGPLIGMYGGQTFNIKQDFRDQDPDRVVMMFRQDLVKGAMSRVQARTASPFGL